MQGDPHKKYQVINTEIQRKQSLGLLLLRTLMICLRYPIMLLSNLNITNIKRLRTAWRSESLSQILNNLKSFLTDGGAKPGAELTAANLNEQYQIFRKRVSLSPAEISHMRSSSAEFSLKPLITVVVPVYNAKVNELNSAVESVLNQIYSNWELCLYDDGSTLSATREYLNTLMHIDSRIRVEFGGVNKHISAATNHSIAMAKGKYIGFLDQDDQLSPNALFEVVEVINDDPEVDLIYSDHDKLSARGRFENPYFKPDFNPDLLLMHNYIGHFVVVRKSVGDEIGWCREEFEGSQDYDLLLRITASTQRIRHIPKVLYHWRQSANSTATDRSNKPYVDETSIKALEDQLSRLSIEGFVDKGRVEGTFHVKRNLIGQDLVSIIIPFRDKPGLLRNCVDSLRKHIDYPFIEILLISNRSESTETFDLIHSFCAADERIKFHQYDQPFNYSAMNNWAAERAQGRHLLFLNNDTQAIHDDWLTSMLVHIQRKEVGAVGCKLLYPDKTIQHAGVIIGIGGTAGHAHRFFPESNSGYYGRADLIQNVSACTGACLLVKRSVFQQIKGFDQEHLQVSFSDIDLCLRIREAGYLIVYTPYARLIHHESKSRGADPVVPGSRPFEEVAYFQSRWQEMLKHGDPYYNVNLTLEHTDFSLRMNK